MLLIFNLYIVYLVEIMKIFVLKIKTKRRHKANYHKMFMLINN